ncbi:DNA-binding transcriptional LysR family regulator [Rhodoligotrophos appendicifer]|uniref:LysR family transcriptional regulator n=1 Tax=Rhodoligotrophos appendicifer TaxID=987056 RepID=UPI0011863ECC|nr:LysR family transcriptional regulator [Rhodoligotrophos appendicifer]
MLDRFTSMTVFARVASLASFSAAARELGLSQTMVTKHVNALERRLNTRLLNRSTRRLSLTDAGRDFLEACTRLLLEIEEAEAAITEDRSQPRGMLRLNAPVSFGTREIAPLLADFAAEAPQVSVDLGLNDRLIDLVEEGWDLAIRIGSLKSSALIAKRLAPCRTLVCAAPRYLAEHGTPTRVEELEEHNCLSYTLSTVVGHRRWTFGRRRERMAAVSGNLQANNGDALVAAAIRGQGIIYQPTFLVADAVRSGALVPLTLDEPPIEIDGIYAVYAPGQRVPERVRAFIDFLAQRFTPVPPWDRGLDAAGRSAGGF